MGPINGIWLCLGLNHYGQGCSEQQAYNNFRQKVMNLNLDTPISELHISDIGDCQFVFATAFSSN